MKTLITLPELKILPQAKERRSCAGAAGNGNAGGYTMGFLRFSEFYYRDAGLLDPEKWRIYDENSDHSADLQN